MKKQLLIFATAVALFTACNNDKKTSAGEPSIDLSSDDSGKTGSFSVDGTSYKGDVTTQYFGSDKEKSNFSVLCQESKGGGAYALLQTTFVNEKDALTNPNLKLHDDAMLPMTEPELGLVTVTLSGSGQAFGETNYIGSSKPGGSITVSKRTLIIKDLKLVNREGKELTINCEVPF